MLTVLVFAVAIVLVMTRPFDWPEAVWTCLAAAVLMALHAVTPRDALSFTLAAGDALLFLLGLMILAALVERSGFFDWAAIVAARHAAGRTRALYRNVFVLGVLITAMLSLDTTAVILTPLVLAVVRRLRLPARPFVFACAFVANTASLLLPVSNLTNLLFAGRFHLSFGAFAARMFAPQCVALAVNYALFWRLFRRDLPEHFSLDELPEATTVIRSRAYFRASGATLGLVGVGYFVAPLVDIPSYAVVFAGCMVLLVACIASGCLGRTIVRHVNWLIFPFIAGLFVMVHAIENLGLAHEGAAIEHALPRSTLITVPATAAMTALLSNIVNNLPAALVARSVLDHARAQTPVVLAALIGTNLGPNLVVFGSLATMLVLTRARSEGDAPTAMDFFRVGARVTPLVLLSAALTLVASSALVARW